MLSDVELLNWYRTSASPDAFDLIVQRHGPMVLRVCLRQLRHRQDAEDASQLTFFRLAQRPEAAVVNLGGWLSKVARDQASNLRLARRRRADREQKARRPMVALREPDFEELREEIDSALVRLSPALREAVILHYLEGRDYEEASQIAGCSEEALRLRAMRGLRRLKEILTRRGMSCGLATLTAFLGAEAVAAASPSPQAMLAMSQAHAVGNAARRAAQPAIWGKLKAIAAVATVGGGLTLGAIRHEANRAAPPPASPTARPPDVTAGLIHRYAFDEPGGATAADSAGDAPGTLVNNPARVAGRVGPGALAFNGVDQYVAVPEPTDLRFSRSQSFTLSAWVDLSPASFRGRWAGLVTKSRDAKTFYGIWLDPKNHPMFCHAPYSKVVPASGWHLLTAVQDGPARARTLYLDGEKIAAGVALDCTSAGDLWIGGAKSVPQFFVGAIDDVRVYDRALDAAEVRALRDAAD